jgi:hypothetical protein
MRGDGVDVAVQRHAAYGKRLRWPLRRRLRATREGAVARVSHSEMGRCPEMLPS